jgi:hypothetical protein
MYRLTLFTLSLLFSVFLFAQSSAVVWRGLGVYPDGSVIATVMKKMQAQKNIELRIDHSGMVKGTLVTRYNSSLDAAGSHRESEECIIAGRYEPVKNMLLLVLTQIRQDSTRAVITFSKPDSVYYRLSIQQDGEKVSVLALADETLNKNVGSEWIGATNGEGMGMDVTHSVGLHLLPLRMHLEGDPLIQSKPAEKMAARKIDILQTIFIDTSYVQLALYDNGYVDGDTATLLLDGKTIVDKKLLSSKAIRFNIDLPKEPVEHVLELFANNLGSIPPNTALLVVVSGKKRYEINLSSTLLVNSGVKLMVRK